MAANSSHKEKNETTEVQEIFTESASQPDHDTGSRESQEQLGEKLQNARTQKGLEIDDICQQTKISRKNIIAIEASQYDKMPAFSFCRGFYRIYANTLGLDAEQIVSQFEQEYNRQQTGKNMPCFSLTSNSEEINSMAERPSLSAFSSLGFILVLLLFFTGFLCWIFSWNPANFLSQQLRNISPENRYETSIKNVPAREGLPFRVIAGEDSGKMLFATISDL